MPLPFIAEMIWKETYWRVKWRFLPLSIKRVQVGNLDLYLYQAIQCNSLLLLEHYQKNPTKTERLNKIQSSITIYIKNLLFTQKTNISNWLEKRQLRGINIQINKHFRLILHRIESHFIKQSDDVTFKFDKQL